MKNLPDLMLAHFPTLLTVLTLPLVVGFGFGGFAAMANSSSPKFQSAAISADGSTCSIIFSSDGSGERHLSQVSISYASSSVAVSFASSFPIPPGLNTEYPCHGGTQEQFVPGISGLPGGQYNLTARFDNGAVATFSSSFG